MNTEDRLRRASREMDKVTASISAPPMAELRRSTRLRGIAVTIATAIAVLVLVGGTLLLLSGRGATTLEPAAPGETTTTSTIPPTTAERSDSPSETYVFPAADPLPPVELDARDESPLYPVDDYTRPADIDQIGNEGYLGPFVGDVEIVVVGQVSTDVLSPRLYAVRGLFANDTDAPLAGRRGECLVLVDRAGRSATCGQGEAYGLMMTGDIAEGTYVAGRAAEGSTLVVIRSGAVRSWQSTRDGYFFATIGTVPGDALAYTFFDPGGEVVDEGALTDVTAVDDPTTQSVPCSAGEAAVPDTFDAVPEDVLATVLDIVDAAQQCDYTRLETIAGDEFTASYGGSEPSDLWTQQEENGDKPMYWLLSILNLPYGTIETDNGPMYVWPAAYAHQGSWETTPQQDMDALRSLYTEDDLQSFADFGGYYGYRVGITASGDWLFFVAGD